MSYMAPMCLQFSAGAALAVHFKHTASIRKIHVLNERLMYLEFEFTQRGMLRIISIYVDELRQIHDQLHCTLEDARR